MVFILVSLFSTAAVILGLTLHRFMATGRDAPKKPVPAFLSKGYRAWMIESSIRNFKGTSLSKWRSSVERLGFWRYPDLEKWLFVAFYASFAYLAASGFFFAFFIPRGLYGYPLLLHVVAGAVFAVSLSGIVLLRARNYDVSMISLPKLDLAELTPERLGFTEANVQKAAFWVFALSGFLLTASALFPMLRVFRTTGQTLMFELHRYSALAAVLSGAVFVDLESLRDKRSQSQPRA